MKRTITLVLVLSLVLTVFVGCQQKAPEPEKHEVATKAPEETAEKSAEDSDWILEQVGEINSNPLSDIRVRQAIAYAIDVDTIAETLLEGKAKAANSLIASDIWKADGLDYYKYDPEKAKTLLEMANWDPNYVLDVAYYYSDQLTVDLMSTIQAYLEDVGIKMTFKQITGDIPSQLWVSPSDQVNGPAEVDWDLVYGAIAAPVYGQFYGRFTSEAKNNSHTPTDPNYDALVKATMVADQDAQIAAYKALTAYENKALYELPLYHQQVFIFESDRVDRKGIPYGNEQFSYDWRIIDWDVEPDEEGNHTLYSNSGPVEFFSMTHLTPGLMMTNKLIFDKLLTSDGALTPTKGQLAESYKLSEDGLTLELVIRDGVKWHDGTPFTAEDVKFSYEYYIQYPGLNSACKNTIANLVGAKEFMDGTASEISGIVVDGNKVTLKLTNEDPDILFVVAQWPPLPKHLLEGTDATNPQQSKFWQNPVGTGPFVVKDVNLNDYCTLTRFADYWDTTGTGNIETISLSPSADADPNLVVNAEAGKIDYAFNKVVSDVIAIEKLDFMKVVPVDIRYTRLLYFNKFPKK